MRKVAYFAAILMVALVFLGAGCFKKDQTGEQNQVQFQGSESNMEEFSATIEEMAKKGKPYACEYSMDYEGVKQQGMFYFAGENKFRGEVKMNIPQMGERMSYFIKDGDTQYIWGDDQPNGIKMTITDEDEEYYSEQMEESDQQNIDLNMQYQLKCRKWNIDPGMFAPPSNVQFQDLDAMMKGFQNMGATSGGPGSPGGAADYDICGLCSQLPAGEARDECIKENCN